MSEPTPGPWEAGVLNVWAQNPRVSIEDRSWRVAEAKHHGTKRHHGPTPAEAEANARLIAAAPDMLEALERLVDLGFSDRLYSDEEKAAWENVEKAIQKARGEAKGEFEGD